MTLNSDNAVSQEHFHRFALSLERAIEKYGGMSEENLLEKQKAQLEGLAKAETDFRQALIEDPRGADVYKEFIHLICEEKGNILAARPYFRERQTVFTAEISKALSENEHRALYRFHVNYQFVRFAISFLQGQKQPVTDSRGKCRVCQNPIPATGKRGRPVTVCGNCKTLSKLLGFVNEITRYRTELTEMNLPLAISRARLFWSKTPKSQLSYMDLVQIACEGLMAAVDKFVLPYTPVFRAVIIGRCSGNMIEQYSETPIHFYPCDKRKLYRARKLINRIDTGVVDYEQLAEGINKDVANSHKTNAAEIADLLAASSCVSSDNTAVSTADGEADVSLVNRFSAPADTQPDVRVETVEAIRALEVAIRQLSPVEKKLLIMKGVTL